jgi:hypothetical protein
MRRHALDPQWQQDVLHVGAWDGMRWERWVDWQTGDPRWVVDQLDTTLLSVVEVADRIAAWISRERDALRDGRLPLSGAW